MIMQLFKRTRVMQLSWYKKSLFQLGVKWYFRITHVSSLQAVIWCCAYYFSGRMKQPMSNCACVNWNGVTYIYYIDDTIPIAHLSSLNGH